MKVFVIVQCDNEDQWPVAVYARKNEAEREAERLEAEQKPEAEMKLSETHYAFRVDEVEFLAPGRSLSASGLKRQQRFGGRGHA